MTDIEFLSLSNIWESIDKLMLIEGKSYTLKITGNYTLQTTGLNVELDKNNLSIYKIIVPFKTGISKIILLKNNKPFKVYEKYIYPDDRKIIFEDYIQMMTDVVSYNNLSLSINDENVEKDKFQHIKNPEIVTPSESMFIFFQNFFELIIPSIKSICKNPIKKRENIQKKFPIHRTDKLDASAVNWISNNSDKCFNTSEIFPTFFKSKVNNKSYDIYENIVIYNILNDLISLCNAIFKKHKYVKAKRMEHQLLYYLNRSHLKSLTLKKVNFKKTSKIRMNENYSRVFDFYKKMKIISFKVTPTSINLLSLPLSKTYKLYEIWTYLKLVEILKNNNKIDGGVNIPIFYNKKEECFDIAHGDSSRINLKNGYYMYYQKNFVKEGALFTTYTSTLIPDISIVKNDQILILDSKYRISNNLDGALAELHKYRDGIVVTKDRSRAVKESYIVTPTFSSRLEVHNKTFQSKWNMGCIMLKPKNNRFLNDFIMDTLFPSYPILSTAVFYKKSFKFIAICKEIDSPGVLLTRDFNKIFKKYNTNASL